MQLAINAIQMQGKSDTEEDKEQPLPPLQPDINQQTEEDDAPPEKLMHISAAAYTGSASDSTISLLLNMKGAQAIAIADTGSTNTFLDYAFAIKHNIPMQAAPARIVVVAGGTTLKSEAIAYNCTFQIQNTTFTSDFRILPLKGSDVILGVNWFKRYNPVTFDFLARSLTLKHDGQTHTFLDHLVPSKHLLISAEDCAKMLDQGATGYLLYTAPNQDPDTGDLSSVDAPAPILDLLYQFPDIFSPPEGLPPHRAQGHSIPLVPDAKPPNIRPYRMSHSQKNALETIVKQMLKNNEIQLSSSPFSSPVLLVKKKDKSWRLCVDYRSLNDLTIKNKFPIPVIEDLLDELHGATVFTKLDLRSGYHQIRMKEEDIPKTAFSTHLGHYEYKVMPFGLSNAPATFQALMNNIFATFLRKFVLVFFDDILIYSATMEQHTQHLKTVLQTLRTNQLKAKLSKCTFAQPQVEYLGNIISEKGVATDPAKIADIVKWPVPLTVKKLKGFLGFTGYYRRYIKGYALICQPLFAVLKKDSFIWGPEQQAAFELLKQVMSNPPLLCLPDFS